LFDRFIVEGCHVNGQKNVQELEPEEFLELTRELYNYKLSVIASNSKSGIKSVETEKIKSKITAAMMVDRIKSRHYSNYEIKNLEEIDIKKTEYNDLKAKYQSKVIWRTSLMSHKSKLIFNHFSLH
jgi:hypothetical protein